ncbi:hypothetical protein IKE71_02115 [Candidatus Saccharibacteria bacterium]|nr:hypothetical protein [Candidatus Saccharibacteria bacterium]
MSEQTQKLTEGGGEEEFIIPNQKNNSALDSVKVEFEDFEPKPINEEADPATMDKIRLFRLRMAGIGGKTLNVYRKVA